MIRREENYSSEIYGALNFLFTTLFSPNFKVDEFENFEFSKDSIDLKLKLSKLISEFKFCDAEELLFNEISKHGSNRCVLQVGVWFFWKLNEFDDKMLEDYNFPRVEILQGLQKIENKVIK